MIREDSANNSEIRGDAACPSPAPGRLIYVMGPSGSGKDSVMAYARERCGQDTVFAHRYITRPPDAGGENHVALTPDEFRLRRDRGLFALYWESHGLCYGVGCEIDLWMRKGLDVVVNGSRGYLDEAAWRYAQLAPVLVSVDAATLRQRLSARGRESAPQIERRLARARRLDHCRHPRLVRIDNSGPLHQAGSALLDLLGCPARDRDRAPRCSETAVQTGT